MRPSLLHVAAFALLALQARAQTFPAVGDSTALDVATWNIEWFGDPNNGPTDDVRQRENVRAVVAGAGIDLWAVQEIADADDFDALLSALGPDYDGRLATNIVSQRVGFLYDTRVVHLRSVRHILEDFLDAFASRPPLQLEADILLPDTTFIVTFIVVHMKAFADVDSYDRRAEAALRLKNHIDFTSLDTRAVVVLGDFNDEMTGSITAGRGSPYAGFVTDTDDYRVLTLPLEQAGGGSFCGNSTCSATGSMIDHLLVTNELFGAHVPGSTRVFSEVAAVFSSYANTTTDHLPVLARFRPPTPTGVDVPRFGAGATLDPPFPNPTVGSTRLVFHLDRPELVRLRVFDGLGREVGRPVEGFWPTGTHEAILDLADRPAGIYAVRLNEMATQWIVVRP
jgi:endonuclease/exonuclease/phosphatase family metal-dependent hydrolase